MCGIAGVASKNSITSREWLSRSQSVLRHRGPDGGGEWWDSSGRVGLAHQRLAIIDLSEAARQPMSDVSGRTLIVFNGEIYNFVELRRELESAGETFRSRSDTEVILAAYKAWGTDCLSRLSGMFAFALYDAERNQVFLARDRAGEKPLFYILSDHSLRFASEIKALLVDPAIPRKIDPEALDCYLGAGLVPGDRCILRGVKKLPPAHAMTFDLATGQSRIWRYWRLPDPPAEADTLDEQALLEQLEALLSDAVQRQLVADVPVGILLSGGVDSSLVTAMAVRASSKVRTFTVRFPGYGRYDETEHARLIAGHFRTNHLELEAQNLTPDLLPKLAAQYDEPIIDSSMIPTYLVSRLVRDHCTVALGGDGGDELFGGYSHYSRILWMQKRLGKVPRPLRSAGAAAGRLLPPGVKGGNYLRSLGVDLDREVPLIATYFDASARRLLLGGASTLIAESVLKSRMPEGGDLLQRATRMDFENYLAEDILVKVDRASMLCSLEMRAPMLDHRLIELAFGNIPSRLKATHDGRKILLKRLAARLLPPEFDQKRKQGFSIPLGDWLREGPWRELFEQVLRNSSSLFDQRFVRNLFDQRDRGRNHGERLFGLTLFELWRSHYGVSL